MSERKRRSFTSQYNTKVALEAIRGVKKLNEIVQEIRFHPTQVGEWKRELLAQAPDIFERKRGPKPRPRIHRLSRWQEPQSTAKDASLGGKVPFSA